MPSEPGPVAIRANATALMSMVPRIAGNLGSPVLPTVAIFGAAIFGAPSLLGPESAPPRYRVPHGPPDFLHVARGPPAIFE